MRSPDFVAAVLKVKRIALFVEICKGDRLILLRQCDRFEFLQVRSSQRERSYCLSIALVMNTAIAF